MRSIISFLLLGLSFLAYAQRTKFQDPELKLSLKKPPGWEIFDNGYVIKVAPSAKDTATTFLTVTYFTPAVPIGEFSEEEFPPLIPESSVAFQFEDFPESKESIKLLKKKVKWRIKGKEGTEFRFYETQYVGQHWEVVVSAPKERNATYQPLFEKIIRSLRAKKI